MALMKVTKLTKAGLLTLSINLIWELNFSLLDGNLTLSIGTTVSANRLVNGALIKQILPGNEMCNSNK